MITADEAKQIVDEEAILETPRFKYMLEELERRIKFAAARGDRSIQWWDYSDPKLSLAWHGDDVFKNKLRSLGYHFCMSDHGHYELYW